MQLICLLSHLSSCTRCVFLLILGEQRSYFVHLYHIQKSLISAQIMGSFSSFDKTLCCFYHNIFYSCGSKDHMIVCSIWYLLITCLYFLYVFVAYDPFICNLWVLNIVCFPPTTYHCICVFLCTHLLRSTHFLEDHQIYWLSKLFVHFGNRCQWGRSLESLLWICLEGFAFIA